MLKKSFNNMKSTPTLIHNITNYVTVNDCANILLAAGSSPIMADEVDEAEDITTICTGLNINIGTLNKRTIPAMITAGKKANELSHPVILDPVGAGASSLRTSTAKKLTEEINFSVIKGNISEIKTLANVSTITKGVDANEDDLISDDNLDSSVKLAENYAKKINAIIVITGKTDIITDGEKTYLVKNGHEMMSSITGTGCMLSGLLAAYISAEKNNILDAAVTAVTAMGICGEIGYENLKKGDGNSTYRNKLIDAMYTLTAEKLEERANYELYKG